MDDSYLPVSVCIPVYNAAPYLRECLDSVLAQTFRHFELLIVDDGSTDDSVEIVRSYQDSRIRLIENRHNYIETLNLLLEEARGKYIARMDADDIMLPDRLQCQWEYMETHSDVDVWAGGLVFMDKKDVCWKPGIVSRPLTLRDFLSNNLFGNPATIIRTSFLHTQGIRYEDEFKYAEDYRFWVRLVHSGAKIVCTDRIFFEFRKSENQATQRHNSEAWEANKRVKDDLERWISNANLKNYVFPRFSETENKLTVIIPFLNEGEEIVNTVSSIRETVGMRVDILVINDQSIDEYPYEQNLRPFDVYYVVNVQRKGVAASRDYGVSLIRTPYFLLLDGHMRFYEKDWLDSILEILETEDSCLVCCQGKALEKRGGEVVEMADVGLHYGAYLPFLKGGGLLDVRWNDEEASSQCRTEEIAVVLGAAYACSKAYWEKLRGLEGLQSYGSDEAYISMKVWLSGGRCLLLKDVVVGHVYRKQSPFRRFTYWEGFNKMLIAYLLFPQSWRCLMQAELCCLSKTDYKKASRLFLENKERWVELRNYYRDLQKEKFSYVIAVNRRALKSKIAALKEKTDVLPQISTFIQNAELSDCGLCEGKAGHLIWLCHYASLSKKCRAEVEVPIYLLWTSICEHLQSGKLPANFKYGWAGVGWAMLYLDEQGLIRENPEKWLDYIDRQMGCLNLEEMEDESVDTGITGFFIYIVARWQYLLKEGGTLCWNENFMHALKKKPMNCWNTRKIL